MKLLMGLLLSFWVMLGSVEAVFIEGLEDVPVQEGLEQIENASLSFGNEEIRLVESYLTSQTLQFVKVAKFYKDTLPQMGWVLKKHIKNMVLFERDGETLELSEESANPLVVRLTVKSKIQ